MNQNLNSTDSKMYRKNVIASYVHFNEMLKIFIISHHQKKLVGLNLFHVRFSEPALNFICCKLQLSDQELVICTVYY